MRILIVFVSLVCAAACSENKQVSLQSFPDPYLDSFRGKGIKYIYLIDDSSLNKMVDTVLLDLYGNIRRIKSFWYVELREYDSLNFITRKLMTSDVGNYYSIDYKVNKDTLVQDWYDMKYYGLLRPDSLNKDFYKRVIFLLSDEGKVIKEVDSLNNSLTNYTYYLDKLTIKSTLSLDSGHFVERFKYHYSKNSELQKIEHYYPVLRRKNSQEKILIDSLIKVYEFKDGLPTAVIEKFKWDRKLTFRYIYY